MSMLQYQEEYNFCVTMPGSARVHHYGLRPQLHDWNLYQNLMCNKGQFLLLLSLSEAHRIFGFASVGCINSCPNTKGVGRGGILCLAGIWVNQSTLRGVCVKFNPIS